MLRPQYFRKWYCLEIGSLQYNQLDLDEVIKASPNPERESESNSHSVVSDSLQPPKTVARQAPLSMEFSRQEYWSGLLFPSPGDCPNPEIEPRTPALQADSFTVWDKRCLNKEGTFGDRDMYRGRGPCIDEAQTLRWWFCKSRNTSDCQHITRNHERDME